MLPRTGTEKVFVSVFLGETMAGFVIEQIPALPDLL